MVLAKNIQRNHTAALHDHELVHPEIVPGKARQEVCKQHLPREDPQEVGGAELRSHALNHRKIQPPCEQGRNRGSCILQAGA
jgi:hypothetical protein